MCYTFSTLFDLKIFAHTFLKNQLGKAFGFQFRDNPWWYLLKNWKLSRGFAPGLQWGAHGAPIPPARLRQTFVSNANKTLFSWYRLILHASRHCSKLWNTLQIVICIAMSAAVFRSNLISLTQKAHWCNVLLVPLKLTETDFPHAEVSGTGFFYFFDIQFLVFFSLFKWGGGSLSIGSST